MVCNKVVIGVTETLQVTFYGIMLELLKKIFNKMPGTEFVEMKRLGHLPMSESHDIFKKYIMPVLEKIRKIKCANFQGGFTDLEAYPSGLFRFTHKMRLLHLNKKTKERRDQS